MEKRIIKFRAWNGKFMIDSAFGDFVSFDGVPYTEPEKRYNTPNIEITKAKDYVLMRFTGILDKSEKEVYEGDLVKFLDGETTSNESGMECDEFETVGEVYWCDTDHRWDVSNRHDVSIEDIFNDGLEVMGNVFQNPELCPS